MIGLRRDDIPSLDIDVHVFTQIASLLCDGQVMGSDRC